jgi:hypothetical protein
MKYAKPSVVELGLASEAIQFHGRKAITAPDGNPLDVQPTTGGAYDLDE